MSENDRRAIWLHLLGREQCTPMSKTNILDIARLSTVNGLDRCAKEVSICPHFSADFLSQSLPLGYLLV